MRSPVLQKSFATYYQDFFTSHDLVVSVPHTLRWWALSSQSTSSIDIRQPLPARMYAGVTCCDTPTVSFGRAHAVDMEKQSIDTSTFEEILWSEQLHRLQTVIKNLLATYGYAGGVVIDLLHEYPQGQWFGWRGSLHALLASVIVMVSRQADPAVVFTEHFETTPLYALIQQVTLYIDAQVNDSPSGIASVTALMGEGLPVVQLRALRHKSSVPVLGENAPSSRHFHTMNTLFRSSMHAEELPIEYGVISFGVSYENVGIERAYQHAYRLMTDSYDRVMGLVEQYDDEDESPLYSQNVSWDSVIYANFLEHWEAMVTTPEREDVVTNFIQSVVDCWLYHLMIEKEIQQFFQIYARFDALKTFPNEKLGLLPLTTSKAGGSILFVTRRGISQETIAQIMDRLRHQYRTVTLKYASRRDGICTHGLQINQCLSQDIYSPYVMPGAVVFVGGDGRRYIAPHQEVMQRENTGVLLDHVYGKVYVEGHKATYKQLRSQSWTTDIMSILLKSLGKYVPHTLFPPSSYSSNKNEMLWKIIMPLDALMKSTFGVPLPVECHGGVYDFEMKLSSNPQGLLHLLSRVELASSEIKKRAM